MAPIFLKAHPEFGLIVLLVTLPHTAESGGYIKGMNETVKNNFLLSPHGGILMTCQNLKSGSYPSQISKLPKLSN